MKGYQPLSQPPFLRLHLQFFAVRLAVFLNSWVNIGRLLETFGVGRLGTFFRSRGLEALDGAERRRSSAGEFFGGRNQR